MALSSLTPSFCLSPLLLEAPVSRGPAAVREGGPLRGHSPTAGVPCSPPPFLTRLRKGPEPLMSPWR